MKKIFSIAALACTLVFFASCEKEEPVENENAKVKVSLTGIIDNAKMTWEFSDGALKVDWQAGDAITIEKKVGATWNTVGSCTVSSVDGNGKATFSDISLEAGTYRAFYSTLGDYSLQYYIASNAAKNIADVDYLVSGEFTVSSSALTHEVKFNHQVAAVVITLNQGLSNVNNVILTLGSNAYQLSMGNATTTTATPLLFAIRAEAFSGMRVTATAGGNTYVSTLSSNAQTPVAGTLYKINNVAIEATTGTVPNGGSHPSTYTLLGSKKLMNVINSTSVANHVNGDNGDWTIVDPYSLKTVYSGNWTDGTNQSTITVDGRSIVLPWGNYYTCESATANPRSTYTHTYTVQYSRVTSVSDNGGLLGSGAPETIILGEVVIINNEQDYELQLGTDYEVVYNGTGDVMQIHIINEDLASSQRFFNRPDYSAKNLSFTYTYSDLEFVSENHHAASGTFVGNTFSATVKNFQGFSATEPDPTTIGNTNPATETAYFLGEYAPSK